MNSSRLFSRLLAAPALWVFFALAPLAPAATNQADASHASTNHVVTNQMTTNLVAGSKTNAVAGTNAAPAELPIPLAVFDLALKPTKDPFFPLTARQPIPVIVSTNAAPATFSTASFTLKGLSGSANLRLALINNRTLAVGETAEITTHSGGKIKIRCVEIKESSVIIRADNQPESLEIFLRKAAQ